MSDGWLLWDFGRSYPKKLQTHEEIPTVFWGWYTPYQWGQYPWCNLLRYSIKLLNNDKRKEKKHFISGPVDIFKAMTMRTTNLILNWQFSNQQYTLNIPKPRKYIWFRHPLEILKLVKTRVSKLFFWKYIGSTNLTSLACVHTACLT